MLAPMAKNKKRLPLVLVSGRLSANLRPFFKKFENKSNFFAGRAWGYRNDRLSWFCDVVFAR
jgi:hypothetical protein